MLCQLCLENVATRQLTERSHSGGIVRADYCDRCFHAKYVEPPADSGRFPTPTFTIKNIMILAGVWAVPNAITAWVFRSGYVTGTPAQVRQWTVDSFLALNLVVGFFVVWLYLLEWLGRVMSYKATGNFLPMPRQRLTIRQSVHQVLAVVPLAAWCVAAGFLERWLTPRLWPSQRQSLPLQTLLMWAPLVPLMLVRLSKNRYVRERMWQSWRSASPQERLLRLLAISWSVGLVLLVVFGGENLVMRGFKIWFPIPPIIFVGIVGQMALLAAAAFTTARR
jgi:hypothetical protein